MSIFTETRGHLNWILPDYQEIYFCTIRCCYLVVSCIAVSVLVCVFV